MRTLKFLLRKEFKQVFRDPAILKIMLAAPLMQLLVLPWAADYEIKHIQIAVVDEDHSAFSQEMINKILSSGYFELAGYEQNYDDAYELIKDDEADLILHIPKNFERDLTIENKAGIYIAANAINGVKALVGTNYLNHIIIDFNNTVRARWYYQGNFSVVPLINIDSLNWYNPMMNYKIFMVPGILVFLVTMVGSIICALNIVKEKEIGTIEQINVTPVRKHIFILGKLIPFWIIGFIVFTLGLFIAWAVYGIVPRGNLIVLYTFLALYLIAILGMGLLISTYSSTQQQAMSLAFFFILVFNLLSGLFTPVESMPDWAIKVNTVNPLTYFIDVMRLVVLKGSGFNDIWNHLLVTAGFAVFFNGWAILNYKKTS